MGCIKPIKIIGNKVVVRITYSCSLNEMAKYLNEGIRYLHEKDFYWKDSTGKYHKIKKNTPKSISASKIIDLRLQYSSFLCEPEFDPVHNPVIGNRGDGFSLQDMEYQYHFVHRHGFPSAVRGPGRGQSLKVRDILRKPLSYLLMKSSDHENYDRETGEWRNNQYQKNAS